MKNFKDFFKRFGNTVYLLILAFAVILFLIASYQVKVGPWHELLIDLAASLVATALLFFLVVAFLGFDPQTQGIEEKLEHIHHDLNLLRGTTQDQPFLIWEREFLGTSPFNTYVEGARELFVSGGHLYNLLKNQNEVLRNWLGQKRNTKLKVILENPETARNGRTPIWIINSTNNREKYAQEIEDSLEILSELSREFTQKIEVRLTDEVPSLTVMIADRKKAVICLNLYFGKPDTRPIFELSKTRHSEWFRLFEDRYYNRLWAEARFWSLNNS